MTAASTGAPWWRPPAGILVALLGLLVPGLGFLFSGAWFTATFTSFLLYYALMRKGT